MAPAQQTIDFVTTPLLFLTVFVGAYIAFVQCCHRAFLCVSAEAVL